MTMTDNELMEMLDNGSPTDHMITLRQLLESDDKRAFWFSCFILPYPFTIKDKYNDDMIDWRQSAASAGSDRRQDGARWQ